MNTKILFVNICSSSAFRDKEACITVNICLIILDVGFTVELSCYIQCIAYHFHKLWALLDVVWAAKSLVSSDWLNVMPSMMTYNSQNANCPVQALKCNLSLWSGSCTRTSSEEELSEGSLVSWYRRESHTEMEEKEAWVTRISASEATRRSITNPACEGRGWIRFLARRQKAGRSQATESTCPGALYVAVSRSKRAVPQAYNLRCWNETVQGMIWSLLCFGSFCRPWFFSRFDHALMLATLEQMVQDEMLSQAAGGADDFMAGLEDLICIDDAPMSAIWWSWAF